jgi:YfiH family protein
VDRNRQEFAHALGARIGRNSWPAARLRQVHSDVVHTIREVPESPLTGDGVITNVPGVLIAVLTADCVPVLLADPKHRAVGTIHAGWRGTLARIVEKGLGAMRRDFGSEPVDIVAAIGPAIRACCYEVSEELRDKFESQFEYGGELFSDVFASDPVRERYPLLFMNMRAPGHGAPPSKPHLDLIEANRRQLLSTGVPERNISVVPLCTSCRTDLLFSHRKERGHTGRMMAAIGIRPETKE